MSTRLPNEPADADGLTRVRRALFVAGLAYCLTPWADPPRALALGILLALLGLATFANFAKVASRILIQTSVVLLGFSISLGEVAKAGLSGLAFAAGTIVLVFASALILRRLLKTDRQVSALLTAGTAICGGSAIAATGSIIGASASAMSVATAVVFLLNACGVYLYPVIGHWLGLSQHQFGAWAAVGIHDVAGVVAAAHKYGETALNEAAVIKLTRVLWIVPVALVLARSVRLKNNAVAPCASVQATDHDGDLEPAPSKKPLPIPWFIALFILACLARTLADRWLGSAQVTPLADTLKSLAKIGMTIALFLIGTGLSRKAVAEAGWRTLLQGIIMWVIVSVVSLLVVRATVG